MAKSQDDKNVKSNKQSTLMGFFGKPKPGPAPTRTPSLPKVAAAPKASTSASSPTSTTLRTPSSVAGSSPTVATNGRNRATSPTKEGKRAGSPLKAVFVPGDEEDDDELTPPPLATSSVPRPSRAEKVEMDELMEVDEANDGSPVVMSRRTKRKKIVYAESDSEASSSEEVTKSKQATGRKPRKSLKADSDTDDYVFDEQDDIAFLAVADEYEASVASGSQSGSPAPALKAKKASKPTKGGFVAPKSVPKKATTSWYPNGGPSSPPPAASSSSSRPGPAPLAGGSRAGSSQSSAMFVTEAERRKEAAMLQKRENENCFEFIKETHIRDKNGNRPDHPEYDKRTIKIPASSWKQMTPFEVQFWEIKQNHFDTVLFFQKGKFFELYEEDARIGHSEFDLKLTDRVKMAMVGVPEQSFELWAAKFLAAGYKVGKVEQAETALGKDMRAKGGEKEKIVRRELAQVFTNGTIVDPTYLTTDEANHCVAIKEHTNEQDGTSSFGICVLDASTGEFSLTAFDDDIVRTRLVTMFRQIRPKELIYAKDNLSVDTSRLLRSMLPSNTLWESFRDGPEFCNAGETLKRLAEVFETEDDPEQSGKAFLPDAIADMTDNEIAMEALGGMLFYLRTLNLDKDLVSQKNFNIYDPIREGKSLVLDGVTLGHMEVLVNNEGGLEGTLLELLQRCQTPSGKRLFKIWLSAPLLDPKNINDRLDAVDDLMAHPDFTGAFRQAVKKLPDLERHLSRIHAGSMRETIFLQVVDGFETIARAFEQLSGMTEAFASPAIGGLLRSAPDLRKLVSHVRSLYTDKRGDKTVQILPRDGEYQPSDDARAEVEDAENKLEALLKRYKRELRCPDIRFWSSAQGLKEIYQIEVPADVDVPRNWAKQGGTKKSTRYYNSEVLPIIRAFQEAKENESTAKKAFFSDLLRKFDEDRKEWLQAVRVLAELDCLVSLAIASHSLDEPKCRPEFVDTPHAFIDFEELRHPSMCLRSDFIANDVRMGGTPEDPQARTVLLTGPNMAGKSTLLRMTAAGIIMAQLGCYVPAAKARLSPVDKIQTRMGAYDNMFASASTFKVELDECSKILREAGPRSFVILDELGRGTSTYDGMAIAGAVLHHLATHTLPLAFFATHYGSLTDDYVYHPNISNMHMKTHVDDEERQVVFLYKLIPGVAESSHGTHVARMAGVPTEVVTRADGVSAEFFQAFKQKMAGRRRSALPTVAHADFTWLMKVAKGIAVDGSPMTGGEDDTMTGVASKRRTVAGFKAQLDVIRRAIGHYEQS